MVSLLNARQCAFGDTHVLHLDGPVDSCSQLRSVVYNTFEPAFLAGVAAMSQLKAENNDRRIALHAMILQGIPGPSGEVLLYNRDNLPQGSEAGGKRWRFASVENGQVTLSSGGAVVGLIPQGLPDFNVPVIKDGIKRMIVWPCL